MSLKRRFFKVISAGIIILLLSNFVGGGRVSAYNPSAEGVFVVASSPYNDVSELTKALEELGFCSHKGTLKLLPLSGSFADKVAQLKDYERTELPDGLQWRIVSVGGSSLPVRWWLTEEGTSSRVSQVVYVAAPNKGSVTAEMIYGELRSQGALQYRSATGLQRRTRDPQWSRPAFTTIDEYLALRGRNLFEPLYYQFLVREKLSLESTGPESARSFFGWLAMNYPARLANYLSDAETPLQWDGRIKGLHSGSPGRMLTWGYLDFLSAAAARYSYTTSIAPQKVLTEDIITDIPVVGDWRAAVLEFVRRRLTRFARQYVLPRLGIWSRHRALNWLQEQMHVNENTLLYQIPGEISIPWSGGELTIPANQLLSDLRKREENSTTPTIQQNAIALRAPNVLKIANADVGPNDWWTELHSASMTPTGTASGREVFVPVGGAAGSDEQVAAEVTRTLGFQSASAGSMRLSRRLLQAVEHLIQMLWNSESSETNYNEDYEAYFEDSMEKGRAPVKKGKAATSSEMEEPAESTSTEQIPQITAVYRNKNTTLKSQSRLYHTHWVWDFGNGERYVCDDSSNISGEKVYEFEGAGQYPVSATSFASDGRELQNHEWLITIPEDASTYEKLFQYNTVEEIVPDIQLLGPAAWVTGKPAHYQLDVQVDPPQQVENLQIVCYPECRFEVVWERPGEFEVKGAVNLRYSWRFPDGTSKYFSVIYVEKCSVEVLGTTLLNR